MICSSVNLDRFIRPSSGRADSSYSWRSFRGSRQDLSDLQTVGIGLYLALGVIQMVSVGGIATLRRRVTSLDVAVRAAALRAEAVAVRSLQTEVGRLEIGLEAMQRRLLVLVFALFVTALIYFTYTALHPSAMTGVVEIAWIASFYLAVPVMIFVAYAWRIHARCKSTAAKVSAAERRFMTATFKPNPGD